MCYGCWKQYGKPNVVNTETQKAVDLIGKVYDFSVVGGNLHIHLDDWNLEDEHFSGELEVFRKDASVEQIAIEQKCYQTLGLMTLDERATALAIHEGMISIDMQN